MKTKRSKVVLISAVFLGFLLVGVFGFFIGKTTVNEEDGTQLIYANGKYARICNNVIGCHFMRYADLRGGYFVLTDVFGKRLETE